SGEALPTGWEPVSMSCVLGVSPRPFTMAPFSVSADCLTRLLPRRARSSVSPCRSASELAIFSPFALYPGPFPMRWRGRGAFFAPPPRRSGERLANPVSSGEAAQIGSFAGTCAGDEKAHGLRGRLLLRLVRERHGRACD